MKVKNPTQQRNRLIIIGNGFDLSVGLKTSYKDFLYYYIINSLNKIFVTGENRPTKMINGKFQVNDKLSQIDMPANFNVMHIRSLKANNTTYDELYQLLTNEKYFSYVSILLQTLQNRSVLKDWIDLEILYYDSLIYLYKKENDIIEREKLIEGYNKQFNEIKSQLVEYLQTIEPYWIKDGKVCKSPDEIPEIYHYLENFFFKLLNPMPDTNYVLERIMFLNFNYTSTIEHLLKIRKTKKNIEINHIHGSLNDSDSIIFGYGDEKDKSYLELETERTKELFRFIKSPYYFQNSNYSDLNKFISEREYEVFILGHSCGLSDRTLFNEILENDKCKLIRLFYHQSKDGSNDKMNKSIEIIRHFEDKVKMRGKIKEFDKEDLMWQLKPKTKLN